MEATHEPTESPQGFGVRWLAGNGADTALEFMARVQAKAVCALTPHPPHSKTLLRDAVLGPNARPMFGIETFHEHPPPPVSPMGERVSEGRVRGMQVGHGPMRGQHTVEAFHAPPESPQGFGVQWLAGERG